MGMMMVVMVMMMMGMRRVMVMVVMMVMVMGHLSALGPATRQAWQSAHCRVDAFQSAPSDQQSPHLQGNANEDQNDSKTREEWAQNGNKMGTE